MEALVAFNRGDLAAALDAAKRRVQNEPSDAAARFVLAELLCFAGEFERADAQLTTAATLNPASGFAIVQFRGLIRSEVARQDFHSAGRAPELLCESTPELRARLQAAVKLREGNAVDARASLEEADGLHITRAGVANGRGFSELRDCDDLLGPMLEVLSGDGRYFWAPLAQIQSLRFRSPTRPRDQLFREVEIVTVDGAESTAFIPVLYAGSTGSSRPEIQLGRATDWSDDESGVVRGVGQRLYLVDEDAIGVMEFNEISFHAAGAS